MSKSPEESNETLPCPRCGEPMAAGWLDCRSSEFIHVAWKSASGDLEKRATYHASPLSNLRRPAQRCRACESVLVDFYRAPPSPPPPSFEERTTNQQGEPIPEALVAILREGEPRACAKAVDLFARMGQPAVPLLRELLEDENPDVRVDALKALNLIEKSQRQDRR